MSLCVCVCDGQEGGKEGRKTEGSERSNAGFSHVWGQTQHLFGLGCRPSCALGVSIVGLRQVFHWNL